ncbi:MAG: hypothetical protein LBK75_10010 [Oscillospiraceae bacterium]|nr:hypothetical protein [Oscillospiraceae bacterium]
MAGLVICLHIPDAGIRRACDLAAGHHVPQCDTEHTQQGFPAFDILRGRRRVRTGHQSHERPEPIAQMSVINLLQVIAPEYKAVLFGKAGER